MKNVKWLEFYWTFFFSMSIRHCVTQSIRPSPLMVTIPQTELLHPITQRPVINNHQQARREASSFAMGGSYQTSSGRCVFQRPSKNISSSLNFKMVIGLCCGISLSSFLRWRKVPDIDSIMCYSNPNCIHWSLFVKFCSVSCLVHTGDDKWTYVRSDLFIDLITATLERQDLNPDYFRTPLSRLNSHMFQLWIWGQFLSIGCIRVESQRWISPPFRWNNFRLIVSNHSMSRFIWMACIMLQCNMLQMSLSQRSVDVRKLWKWDRKKDLAILTCMSLEATYLLP